MTITLYGAPRSRSLRVAWMLEELGLEWDYHYVSFRRSYHRSEDYLALNPAGKVPALRDGELVLIESSAICQYLAERYGQGRFLPPPGSREAALHHQWVSFIIAELEQPLWTLAKHKFALPKEQRVPGMLEVAPLEFARAAAVAERWVPAEGCLLGAEPRVADILLGQTLSWALSFEQALPDALNAYHDAICSRPALKAALDREAEAAVHEAP